jgi:hypothetical protein
MFIEKYFNTLPSGHISFTRQQASNFAKEVADDFNPIHNVEAKRFCVPGDLLFALILIKAGLHQQMTFTFSGMVTDDIALAFPSEIHDQASVVDKNNKEYLHVNVSGEKSHNQTLIDSLIKAYVEFSGHTFPHILVQLMAENNVMINPSRPMIMYQSMSINMHSLALDNIALKLANTRLSIEGKRGDAYLAFDLLSNGNIVGNGKKHMLLSGLREYDQATINNMIEQYNTSKANFIGHKKTTIN